LLSSKHKAKVILSSPKKYISLFQLAYYVWEFPEKLTKQQKEARKQAFQCFQFLKPFYNVIEKSFRGSKTINFSDGQ
jgi:uncharacterized protein YqhQ